MIAGLEPGSWTPYLCGMDSLGAIETAPDFMVAGTAPDSLYGMCESMHKPDLVSLVHIAGCRIMPPPPPLPRARACGCLWAAITCPFNGTGHARHYKTVNIIIAVVVVRVVIPAGLAPEFLHGMCDSMHCSGSVSAYLLNCHSYCHSSGCKIAPALDNEHLSSRST